MSAAHASRIFTENSYTVFPFRRPANPTPPPRPCISTRGPCVVCNRLPGFAPSPHDERGHRHRDDRQSAHVGQAVGHVPAVVRFTLVLSVPSTIISIIVLLSQYRYFFAPAHSVLVSPSTYFTRIRSSVSFCSRSPLPRQLVTTIYCGGDRIHTYMVLCTLCTYIIPYLHSVPTCC